MKKAYLLVFSSTLGSQDSVKRILNQVHKIDKWRYDIPNSFYIISEHSAREIATEIRDYAGGSGRFIITEIPQNSYGWLTSESWYLIQRKKYKPKAS